MDLEEVIRELPEDVPESERRDLLDDSRDHGDTRAACPGWPNYRAGGAVALRRVAVVRSDLTSQDTPRVQARLARAVIQNRSASA